MGRDRRQCIIQGPGLLHGLLRLLRWSRRDLRDRLVWNVAVIVSADVATSFIVPKIVIFRDVVRVLALESGI